MQSTAGDDTSQTVLKYQHTMIEFDMDTEKTTMFSVPEFVPVIGQSLVYLNAGVSGILVALGGKREMNGTLSLVRDLFPTSGAPDLQLNLCHVGSHDRNIHL